MRILSLLKPLQVDISEAIFTSFVSPRQLCVFSNLKTLCTVHQLLLGFWFGECIFTLKKECRVIIGILLEFVYLRQWPDKTQWLMRLHGRRSSDSLVQAVGSDEEQALQILKKCFKNLFWNYSDCVSCKKNT